jgi:hypothetical protein
MHSAQVKLTSRRRRRRRRKKKEDAMIKLPANIVADLANTKATQSLTNTAYYAADKAWWAHVDGAANQALANAGDAAWTAALTPLTEARDAAFALDQTARSALTAVQKRAKNYAAKAGVKLSRLSF